MTELATIPASAIVPPDAARDAGTTLIEMLMSIVVLGVIMSTLAMTVMTSLRVAPDTETRLDDARATRSLATWLTSDTISAPPFLPEQAQGGIVVDQPPQPNNNDCGAPGVNLLHLQWTEFTDQVRTFVSNYRWLLRADGTAEIARYVCSQTGDPMVNPFVPITHRTMTSGLSQASPPTITPVLDGSGNVESIKFELVGDTGVTVLVETGSRNPADFFP